MALTMNEIVQKVNDLGFSKKKSDEIVRILLEIIKSSLENGEDVLVSGFGKFQVKEKFPRRGRNPETDEDLIIDGRRVITFKCSGNGLTVHKRLFSTPTIPSPGRTGQARVSATANYSNHVLC